jgi:hypothetical protein
MTADPSSDDAPPARFGPFHRLESPTQTPDDARRQEASGELWRREARFGGWAKVKAYFGPLPPGARGVEFYTDAAPDIQGPNVTWSKEGPPSDVRLEGEYAKIRCVVVKNTQSLEPERG